MWDHTKCMGNDIPDISFTIYSIKITFGPSLRGLLQKVEICSVLPKYNVFPFREDPFFNSTACMAKTSYKTKQNKRKENKIKTLPWINGWTIHHVNQLPLREKDVKLSCPKAASWFKHY